MPVTQSETASSRGEVEEVERPPLGDTVRNILEEARMILPGVQTLFGFQLIVVFNQRFEDLLSSREQGSTWARWRWSQSPLHWS